MENTLEGTFAKDGKKGKVFIILFYSDVDDKIKQKNQEYRDALKQYVLDPNPSLYYTEVNVNDKKYTDFASRVIGIQKDEVTKSPSVLIIE